MTAGVGVSAAGQTVDVLVELDERMTTAIARMHKLADGPNTGGGRAAERLNVKAEGVTLARSYVRDALRAAPRVGLRFDVDGTAAGAVVDGRSVTSEDVVPDPKDYSAAWVVGLLRQVAAGAPCATVRADLPTPAAAEAVRDLADRIEQRLGDLEVKDVGAEDESAGAAAGIDQFRDALLVKLDRLLEAVGDSHRCAGVQPQHNVAVFAGSLESVLTGLAEREGNEKTSAPGLAEALLDRRLDVGEELLAGNGDRIGPVTDCSHPVDLPPLHGLATRYVAAAFPFPRWWLQRRARVRRAVVPPQPRPSDPTSSGHLADDEAVR